VKLVANPIFGTPVRLLRELLSGHCFANAPQLFDGSPFELSRRHRGLRQREQTADRAALQFIGGEGPRFSNQQLSLIGRQFEDIAGTMGRHVDPVELFGELSD